jgi:hypothetical protein
VTATLSGDSARLYVDGTLVAGPVAITNDPVSYGKTTQNWLGRSQWGAGDGYFNGLIDDLKIFNYALDTNKVAQEYLAIQGDYVCDVEANDLQYDYNDDCVMNLGDFAIFAQRWLDSYRIYPD